MRRRICLAISAGAVLALGLPSAPAHAGGGCHGAVTHGTGSAVAMRDACFAPAILLVEPGTEVTFSNEDPFTHNVSASWSDIADLNHGDGFRATFDAPGVYPFACTYHPGMTGAIVVGDGTGAGNGDLVGVEPLLSADADRATAVLAGDEPASARSGLAWLGGGAVGLAAGLGIGLTRRRSVER